MGFRCDIGQSQFCMNMWQDLITLLVVVFIGYCIVYSIVKTAELVHSRWRDADIVERAISFMMVFALIVLLGIYMFVTPNVLALEEVEEINPYEYVFIMWDTNDSNFRMSNPSTLYDSLGIEVKSDELKEAISFLSEEAGLTDYLAVIGIWGFKLEATVETKGLLFFIFSRPIELPEFEVPGA